MPESALLGKRHMGKGTRKLDDPHKTLGAFTRAQLLEEKLVELRALDPKLKEPKYQPSLKAMALCQYLLERSFLELEQMETLVNPVSGELRSSIDIVRRLAETSVRIAASLGLSPTRVIVMGPGKMVDIETLRSADAADLVEIASPSN